MNLLKTVGHVAKIIGDATIEGDAETPLTRICPIDLAESGDLAFARDSSAIAQLPTSKASAALTNRTASIDRPPHLALIRVDNPQEALNTLCAHLEAVRYPRPKPGIHATAVIDETAQVDPTAAIGPYAVIGEHSKIGPNVVIGPHAVIGRHVTIAGGATLRVRATVGDHIQIGERAILHEGCVLGSDGFGFDTVDGRHRKVPQVGDVIIEADAEVGANTCVDRARFHETRVGEGTKVDNLVQLGHNCRIGRHSIICAQIGTAGSTVIGDYVVAAGQIGFGGHIKVGNGAKITGQSGINNDVPPGATYRGTPAQEYSREMRVLAYRNRLPELFKKVDEMEAILAGVETPEDLITAIADLKKLRQKYKEIEKEVRRKEKAERAKARQ